MMCQFLIQKMKIQISFMFFAKDLQGLFNLHFTHFYFQKLCIFPSPRFLLTRLKELQPTSADGNITLRRFLPGFTPGSTLFLVQLLSSFGCNSKVQRLLLQKLEIFFKTVLYPSPSPPIGSYQERGQELSALKNKNVCMGSIYFLRGRSVKFYILNYRSEGQKGSEAQCGLYDLSQWFQNDYKCPSWTRSKTEPQL